MKNISSCKIEKPTMGSALALGALIAFLCVETVTDAVDAGQMLIGGAKLGIKLVAHEVGSLSKGSGLPQFPQAQFRVPNPGRRPG